MACGRMNKQVKHRQRAAVDDNDHIRDEAECMAGLYVGKVADERDNEDKIIAQKSQQLAPGIIPARSKRSKEKVAGRTQKRPANDDRGFRTQRPRKNRPGVPQQGHAGSNQQNGEDTNEMRTGSGVGRWSWMGTLRISQ